jgi:hypothetical protein
VLSLVAPCSLDLRAASFLHEEATILVLSVLGPVRS